MPDKKQSNQASAKKVNANRANAKKSTGPKTRAGKKKASRNAEKHGILSEMILPKKEAAETEELFDELTDQFCEDFQPESTIEKILVERLVILTLRLRRLQIIETNAFEYEMKEQKYAALIDDCELNSIQRYETMLNRQFYQTLRELRQFKIDRQTDEDRQAMKYQLEISSNQSQLPSIRSNGNGTAKLRNEPKSNGSGPNPLQVNRLNQTRPKNKAASRPVSAAITRQPIATVRPTAAPIAYTRAVTPNNTSKGASIIMKKP